MNFCNWRLTYKKSGGMMCRRGGSKGGKHSDDVTDINVGNTATQWNKHPLGLFYCLNGADLKAKEKTGAMITPAER